MLPASHPPGGPRCNRRLNRAQSPKVGDRVQYLGLSSWAEHLQVTGTVTAVHGPVSRTKNSPYGRRTIVTLPDLTEHDAGDPPDDPDEYRWFVVFKPDRPIPRGWPYAGEAEFESRVGDLQKLDD